MSYTPEEIIQEIHDSFADIDCPDSDHLVRTLNHFQAEYIIRDFAGKHWTEVSAKMLYEYRYDLSLFTPEALHFYLPVFMTISMSNTNDAEYNSLLKISLFWTFDLALPLNLPVITLETH